jgi:hypothetical protein
VTILSFVLAPHTAAQRKICGFAAWFVQRVTRFLVLCFSARYGESVVSQRVLPYITAIGIRAAAASALSFLALAVASGICSA